MRLVFAGTPAAAVPSLEALLKSRHEVAAVVTRPDAPAGRGLRGAPSPVAQRAESDGVAALKPANPRAPDFPPPLPRSPPARCPLAPSLAPPPPPPPPPPP